jgi:para-nitrobenzyl esterase
MRSDRRGFFHSVGAATGGLAIGAQGLPAVLGAAPADSGDDGPVLQIGEDVARVETTHGKVRGSALRGVHHFLGIPYGMGLRRLVRVASFSVGYHRQHCARTSEGV